ncbi:MAG: DUF2970 domain-containing protein [Burkholderiales bacterium]|nr:DUF2970 domain-containing protein [Burkholderiales bacterium]
MAGGDDRTPRDATPLEAAKTVFWAFFGVRRGADHASIRLRPWQIVVAGVLGAALFVFVIVTVVRLVTR